MDKISYIIVGSGYRAKLYARIAAKIPQFFRAIVLCRSQEKAKLITAETGIAATVSIDECLKFGAQFTVVAVNKESIADVCAEWTGRGYPIVAETPAGISEEQLLNMWRLRRSGARITVCEQYRRFPCIAAGLKAVAEGKIGTPYSAYISLAHDYHAASLLKDMLLVNNEGFTFRGQRFENGVVETDSREGPITDGRVAQRSRDLIFICFDSGKEAVYDFSGVQYRSYIRSRNLIVRGGRGEWTNGVLYTLTADNQPQMKNLEPYIAQRHAPLAEVIFGGDLPRVGAFNLGAAQDEFAVASVLYDMPAYIAEGEEIYPLERALDDAYFWLLMQRAVKCPWAEVRPQTMPWDC